jgi:hypothetical protein
MRGSRIEHMLSAHHPIATHERTSRIGRFVPNNWEVSSYDSSRLSRDHVAYY